MARFARARPKPRRMDWVAALSTAHTTVSSGNTASAQIFGPVEASKFTNPTLTRIRGSVILDGDFNSMNPDTDDDSNFLAGVMIYVSPVLNSTWTEAGLTQNDILYTGLFGRSYEITVVDGSAPTQDRMAAATWAHERIEIDVKAQRRLKDQDSVWLSFHNFSGIGGTVITFSYDYLLRTLLKE